MTDEVPQVGEARLEQSADGLRPAGEGWFVVNVAELAARGNARMGVSCSPEPDDVRFAEFGFNLRVLEPGQFNGRYHRENAQEAVGGRTQEWCQGEGFPVDATAAPASARHRLAGGCLRRRARPSAGTAGVATQRRCRSVKQRRAGREHQHSREHDVCPPRARRVT